MKISIMSSATPDENPDHVGHSTTVGARSGKIGPKHIGITVIGWMHGMRSSTFSLGHIDALVDACAHVPDFSQLLMDSSALLDLADPVVASMHAYALAMRDEDFAGMASHSKVLLSDPASPIYIPPSSSDMKGGLPPPTVCTVPTPQMISEDYGKSVQIPTIADFH